MSDKLQEHGDRNNRYFIDSKHRHSKLDLAYNNHIWE
jgi:hypothetical protein